jgi:hypothetical protein
VRFDLDMIGTKVEESTWFWLVWAGRFGGWTAEMGCLGEGRW